MVQVFDEVLNIIISLQLIKFLSDQSSLATLPVTVQPVLPKREQAQHEFTE